MTQAYRRDETERENQNDSKLFLRDEARRISFMQKHRHATNVIRSRASMEQ
jgi:hypothetical protein